MIASPSIAVVLAVALGAGVAGPSGEPTKEPPQATEPAPPDAETRAPEEAAPGEGGRDAVEPTAEEPETTEPPTEGEDAPSEADEASEPIEVPRPEATEPEATEPEPAKPGVTEPEPEPEDWFGDDADDEPFPEAEGDDQGSVESEPLPDYDPLRDSPQAIQARHWVRTGIVLMSTGGALLAGAIIMGASDPCNLKVGNSCQVEARNRAATVMGLPAAALVVGGAVALGVGLHRRQRLTMELQASRTGAGLVLRGRF